MSNFVDQHWAVGHESIGYRIRSLSDELIADRPTDCFRPSEQVAMYAKDFRIVCAYVETKVLNLVNRLDPHCGIEENDGLESVLYESVSTFMDAGEIDQLCRILEAARGGSVSRGQLAAYIIGLFPKASSYRRELGLQEREDGGLEFTFIKLSKSKAVY